MIYLQKWYISSQSETKNKLWALFNQTPNEVLLSKSEVYFSQVEIAVVSLIWTTLSFRPP